MILTIIECVTILLTVAMLVQLSKKNKSAWLISLTTNCMWMYIGIQRKLPVIIVATCIYTFFNIKGYIAWKNDDKLKEVI